MTCRRSIPFPRLASLPPFLFAHFPLLASLPYRSYVVVYQLQDQGTPARAASLALSLVGPPSERLTLLDPVGGPGRFPSISLPLLVINPFDATHVNRSVGAMQPYARKTEYI